MDAGAVGRLTAYFEETGRDLPRSESRESFAAYVHGLLSDGERKSVEPFAVRSCGDPGKAQHAHDRLLHFVAQSPRSDRADAGYGNSVQFRDGARCPTNSTSPWHRRAR